MGRYLLALDQGTTSSRAILFDEAQNIIGSSQKELTQLYPQEGLAPGDITAIGITNQRETTALGAAYLAGLATGVWRDTHELTRLWKPDITFTPNMSPMERDHLTAQWHKAVGRSLHWAK